jgi:poly-gamma-glutamate capsule biosynthesis protein CapA/YwtB (metallophosphatase superfamily)
MNRRHEVTLFLCGDVMTGRGVDQVLPYSCAPHLHERVVTSALGYITLAERRNGPIPRPVGYEYVWGAALDVLERVRPDARIVNLETSVTTSEDAFPKRINYRMHPSNIPLLVAARVDCCVLGNNHVLDWGVAGLLETLDTIAVAGISVAGAGHDVTGARAPAELRVRGDARVLVFGFGSLDSGIPAEWAAGPARPGVHLLTDFSDDVADDIGRAVTAVKRAGDLAVASIHWGTNWGYGIPAKHRRFAHALIDRAGIDAVHGHSSHHPRAIEVYHDRPILYGCGDFITDYEGISGYEEFRDDLVLAYLPTFDARTQRLVRFQLAPFQLCRFQLVRPSPADHAWLRDTLDRECSRFGHRVASSDELFVLTR